MTAERRGKNVTCRYATAVTERANNFHRPFEVEALQFLFWIVLDRLPGRKTIERDGLTEDRSRTVGVRPNPSQRDREKRYATDD